MLRSNPGSLRGCVFLSLFCLCVLCFKGTCALAEEGQRQVNEKYAFSLACPPSWQNLNDTQTSYVALTLGNAQSGETAETLQVRVYPLPEADNLDPAEFVFQFQHEIEEAGGAEEYSAVHPLRQSFSEIEVLSYGATSLGGQSAAYTFSRAKRAQDGREQTRSVLQIFTFASGNIFELTWQAPGAKTWENDSTLGAILASWTFDSPKGQ